ncbi:MAG: phosphoribosylaminoimidazolecarboxamide formyltransferase / cyclohydrolase [Hyphomicrobiales bacterium]|nr:phosphoribosylaminoimidazolecarboxamide formyltransferase / cyclohydrolase [Hyphomicrobiales bacterium]
MTAMLNARPRSDAWSPNNQASKPRSQSEQSKSTSGHSQSDLFAALEAVPDLMPVKVAVASVSNKAGLLELGQELANFGVEIIATEGTTKHLRSNGQIALTDLTGYTGYPENLNGRLKTLHPKLQAGVLAVKGYHDGKLAEKAVAAKYIDLVIVNLYPFRETVANSSNFFECIENIDVGGPALLRAAAKNHSCVAAVCDPSDYPELISELRRHNGHTTSEFRRRCARKVFELTAEYDKAIADWFLTAKNP